MYEIADEFLYKKKNKHLPENEGIPNDAGFMFLNASVQILKEKSSLTAIKVAVLT